MAAPGVIEQMGQAGHVGQSGQAGGGGENSCSYFAAHCMPGSCQERFDSLAGV